MLKFPSPTPFLGTAIVLASIVLGGCQAEPPAGTSAAVQVRSAHSNWIEEQFQTDIINIGLEKLGYKIIPPKEIDYPAAYISIANGELDYSAIYYEPNHIDFFENAGGNQKLEAVGLLVDKAQIGYQIDKRTAEQYNIKTIEQLADPKLAKLFDSDGDGKANLVGCNPGWACELILDHHMEAYGLQDTVENDRGQYITLLGEAITRYQQGGSIFFYAYYPHWVATVLKLDQDVVWLPVSSTKLPGDRLQDLTAEDTSIEGVNYGFSQAKQRIVANKKFLAAHPKIKRWLELVRIPIEDMNAESLRIMEGENRPDDVRRHAEDWFEQNKELVDGWLAEAEQGAQ